MTKGWFLVIVIICGMVVLFGHGSTSSWLVAGVFLLVGLIVVLGLSRYEQRKKGS
jgi:membrane protein YdbS with pleckstrin-like domain